MARPGGCSAFNAYLYVLKHEGVNTEESYTCNGKVCNYTLMAIANFSLKFLNFTATYFLAEL